MTTSTLFLAKRVVTTRFSAIAAGLALVAACGQQPAPATDDALRNDLALATQAQQARPQQVVSPQELATQGYAPVGAVTAPVPQAAAPRVVERVVYRDRPTTTRRSSSSAGGYASAGVYSGSSTGGSTAASEAAAERRRQRAKGRTNGAIIGSAAGAAIGVATSKRSDRLKGGLIGAVTGAGLGAVVGNNTSGRNP